MAIPPWTIEMLRRGLGDVARKAAEPETLEKIKSHASELLHDLPETAARGIDAVMRNAEAGKKSVQRWTRKQTTLTRPLLNASGVLITDWGTGIPTNDKVIAAGVELLCGGIVTGDKAADSIDQRLQELLPSDQHSVAIASSFPAALTAFSLLIQDRPLIVHRRYAIRMGDGQSLPDAMGALLPVVEEVGSADSFLASDYDEYDSFCAIMADDGKSPVELCDFGERDAAQAVVLPLATLRDYGVAEIPSALSTLERGADFAIFPADALCGGPPCGVIVGRREAIVSITDTPQWHALRANQAEQAMTAVAIGAEANEIPVLARLSAGEQNLEDRAQRMATRLRGCDSVASCHVTTEQSSITSNGRWHAPSRQVCAQHQSKSAENWALELQADVPTVLTTERDGSLVIDLRWIAAADDGRLAETIGGDSYASD